MTLREPSDPLTATLPPHLLEVVATLTPELRAQVYGLPPRLLHVLAAAPVFVDRRIGAALVTQHILPASHRSLETWPLPWRHANGKALTPLIGMFAFAYAMLAKAPVIMGGNRRGALRADRQPRVAA